MEYLGDRGGHIVLDHRLSDLVAFLDTLAPNDERSLYLVSGVASVAGSLMTMVGRQDYDAVIVDTSFLDSVHNPLHTTVDSGQFSVVFIRTLAKTMSGVIKGVDVDEAEQRFFLFDVLAFPQFTVRAWQLAMEARNKERKAFRS